MEEVKIFESPQFGQIRTAGTSDEPLFCLVDIARALEYSNPAKAVLDHCKGVTVLETPTNGGIQKIKFGKESEVYRLIMKSNTEKAEAFQDWVCGEVLPSIRKNGGYMAAREGETEQELFARAVLMAKATIDRQQQQLQEANQHIAIAEETIEQQARQIQMANGTIEEQTREIKALAPDAKYTRDVLQSDSTYAISDVAKELRMSGYKLYAKLKALGILFKRGDKWFPYEKYVPKGYFATRTVPFFHRDGTPGSSSYTVLTELGRQWLHSLKIA